MGTTNYCNTFVSIAPDSLAISGIVPSKPGSVAALQHALLADAPYKMTSDDLPFAVHAARRGIDAEEMASERRAFFEKSQACLRASPLPKSFGWGIHHDADGRVAIHSVGSTEYVQLSTDGAIKQTSAMRSKRV